MPGLRVEQVGSFVCDGAVCGWPFAGPRSAAHYWEPRQKCRGMLGAPKPAGLTDASDASDVQKLALRKKGNTVNGPDRGHLSATLQLRKNEVVS